MAYAKTFLIALSSFWAIAFAVAGWAVADTELAPPVRLEDAEGAIDTGPAWGHSSPAIEDMDGDGLADLVLGDFGGKFRVYKNVGSKAEPAFEKQDQLQAGDAPAEVNISCCIGGQPRFVDFDNDGARDFISNSYAPGHCYYFRGLGDGKFEKPVEIVDKNGVPVRSSPEQKQDFQSFGSFYMPTDWDADGDSDLLVGCFSGELKLRINEGDAKNYSFASENVVVNAGDEPLKVSAHCCPVVADWDGDGLWDLVVGSGDGSVNWYRNAGNKGQPKFEKGIELVAKHDGSGYNLLRWNVDELPPGIRSQVEVTDFNNDGKLDLLVGDFSTAYAPRPDLTQTEKDEFTATIEDAANRTSGYVEKMNKLREDFSKRYPGDEAYSDEATEAWQTEYQALRESAEAKEMEANDAKFVEKVRPYLAETHGDGNESYNLAIPHGFVWVYLRK
jgi:hypothetical protein